MLAARSEAWQPGAQQHRRWLGTCMSVTRSVLDENIKLAPKPSRRPIMSKRGWDATLTPPPMMTERSAIALITFSVAPRPPHAQVSANEVIDSRLRTVSENDAASFPSDEFSRTKPMEYAPDTRQSSKSTARGGPFRPTRRRRCPRR